MSDQSMNIMGSVARKVRVEENHCRRSKRPVLLASVSAWRLPDFATAVMSFVTLGACSALGHFSFAADIPPARHKRQQLTSVVVDVYIVRSADCESVRFIPHLTAV